MLPFSLKLSWIILLMKLTSPLGSLRATGQEPTTAMDADEYSNSSRAHLAHGLDQDPLHLRFVKVQGVQLEEEEGGIVCGSLTLGPTCNIKENNSSEAAAHNRLKHQTFSKV